MEFVFFYIAAAYLAQVWDKHVRKQWAKDIYEEKWKSLKQFENSLTRNLHRAETVKMIKAKRIQEVNALRDDYCKMGSIWNIWQ